jgi:hypothetical protein
MDTIDKSQKIFLALGFLGIILVLLQMWWAKRKGASQQELLELRFFRKVLLRSISIPVIYLLFFVDELPLIVRIWIILLMCIWIELYARATNYKMKAKAAKEKKGNNGDSLEI